MPTPVSRTSSAWPSPVSATDNRTLAPGGRVLQGVVDQVARELLQLVRVARHVGARAGSPRRTTGRGALARAPLRRTPRSRRGARSIMLTRSRRRPRGATGRPGGRGSSAPPRCGSSARSLPGAGAAPLILSARRGRDRAPAPSRRAGWSAASAARGRRRRRTAAAPAAKRRCASKARRRRVVMPVESRAPAGRSRCRSRPACRQQGLRQGLGVQALRLGDDRLIGWRVRPTSIHPPSAAASSSTGGRRGPAAAPAAPGCRRCGPTGRRPGSQAGVRPTRERHRVARA